MENEVLSLDEIVTRLRHLAEEARQIGIRLEDDADSSDADTSDTREILAH